MGAAVMDTKKREPLLKFAKLYRDCVESFCLIHQGKKEWDRAQRLLLVKVGIQQAKLLAWSQAVGVCELGEYRVPLLDDPVTFEEVKSIVKGMLDRLVHADHGIQLATYGIKPSKKFVESLEPALDSTRLESFREQYMLLPGATYASWFKATHWTISDNEKFGNFISDTRASVDRLVKLMGVESYIDESVKQDIKAMGWHPVFDKNRAASDGSKLRLIKESCHDEYPAYSNATGLPLSYLNQQWSDHYQETMALHHPYRPQLDKFAKSEEKNEQKYLAGETSPRKQSLGGMFSKLRSHSWHKRNSVPAVVVDPPRASSHAHTNDMNSVENILHPERSKSEGGIASATHHSPHVIFANPFNIDKAVLSTPAEEKNASSVS
jgi:hypothetical protein